MFENWNLGKVVVTGNVVEDTPWWERHGCAIPTPDRTLAEI
jgi:hypothetical protein